MKTLTRHCVLRRLIWVCTVCLCPTKKTLGLNFPAYILCAIFSLEAKRKNSIIELFSHCKCGNNNICIWAWFGYFICSRREIRFYLFGKDLVSCLSCVNVRAFQQNPDRYIYEPLERQYNECRLLFVVGSNSTNSAWEPSDLGPQCLPLY